MADSPVRISAITSNASLVVALTLRVEDWEVVSGGTSSGVDDLEQTDVLLIDRGTTELGLAELSDARARCPEAPAIIIGDQEAEDTSDARLLLRPFTLEELASAINEASLAVPSRNGDGPEAEVTEEEWAATESMPPDTEDTPEGPAPLVVGADDEPAIDDVDEPEPVTLSDVAADEPAVVELGPDDVDEPAPMIIDEPVDTAAAALADSQATVTDEMTTGPAEGDDAAQPEPEGVAADTSPLVDAPSEPVDEPTPAPVEEPSEPQAADPAPPAVAPAEPVIDEPPPEPAPSAPADQQDLAPAATAEAPQAPTEGRGGRRKAAKEQAKAAKEQPKKKRRRRRNQDLEGPAELAAEEMRKAAAQKDQATVHQRVARILTVASDLHALIDEMPILRACSDLAAGMSQEVHEAFDAETVAIWVPDGEKFRVVGGWGLTRAESKAAVPRNQPLLSELHESGSATLIVPIDLAMAAVAGVAGARTKALMGSAIGIGSDRYAHITVGGDDYDEESLDQLVAMAVEAAPLFAVASLMDGFRAL